MCVGKHYHGIDNIDSVYFEFVLLDYYYALARAFNVNALLLCQMYYI